MKLGVRSRCVSKDFEEAMAITRAVGLDGIQVTSGESGALESSDEELLAFKAKVEAAGLEVASGGAGPNLTNPETVEEVQSQFEKIIHAAAVLGHRVITGESKALLEGVSVEDAWNTCIDNVRAICEIAEREDVLFCVEPGGPCLVRTTEDLEVLLAAVDHRRLKINFDGGNLWNAGSDSVDAARRLAPHIAHVHIKDWSHNPEGETALGDGEVDYRAILEILRDTGYNGWLVIEREVTEDAEADTRNAADRLKALVESL